MSIITNSMASCPQTFSTGKSAFRLKIPGLAAKTCAYTASCSYLLLGSLLMSVGSLLLCSGHPIISNLQRPVQLLNLLLIAASTG